MYKRPILVFTLVVAFLTGVAFTFVQSRMFANMVKSSLIRNVPDDLGLEADFSDFAVKMFPPGVSIRNPKLRLKSNKSIQLPENSSVRAERLDLIFRPFQMLTGSIRIHRVVIANGEVAMDFDRTFMEEWRARKKSSFTLHWDQLLQIRAESVALENTRVRLSFADPALSTDLIARELSVTQRTVSGNVGYELSLELADVQIKAPAEWNLPKWMSRIESKGYLDASGLQLDTFDFATEGSQMKVQGRINGDLLLAQDLAAEMTVQLDSQIGSLLQTLLPNSGKATPPEGHATFKGKISGNPLRLTHSLRAKGELAIEGFSHDGWHADRAWVGGEWAAAPGGGELNLTGARLESFERARIGGRHLGAGGRIEMGPLRYRIGSHDPITVPLQLDQAHIHWLTGPGARKVFALDFRVSGTVKADFMPALPKRSWEVLATTDLNVLRFNLDNQKLDRTKPLHKLLSLERPIQVKGDVRVTRDFLRPEGLTISLNKSRFQAGGEIDFATGLNLRAMGTARLEDVGKLSEAVIRGDANLDVRIHGPPSEVLVDFDAQVKNAYYLNLHLGDMTSGRITWDDHRDHLLFTGLDVQRGNTAYTANGLLDLSEGRDTIDIDVGIGKGDIADISGIFTELTEDIGWFPRQLSGPLTGKVKIAGGISLNRLSVIGDVTGSSWDYLGERFKSVVMRGGYDSGRYFIDSLRAMKRTGEIKGRISLDADRRFDWDFRTENMTLSNSDHLARLDVPMKGRLSLQSQGSGKSGAIISSTSGKLTDFTVRGMPMPPSEFQWKSADGISQFLGNALGEQGRIEMAYDFSPKGGSYIRGELRRLDFTPLLLLLNPKSIQDRDLTGVLSGSIDLRFNSGEIERASGTVHLTEYVLSHAGTRFRLAQSVSSPIERGTFRLNDITIRGKGGLASLSLKGTNSFLEGSLRGQVDASIAEFFSPAIEKASGPIALDFNLGGMIKAPTIVGRAVAEGLTVKMASLESPFENAAGIIEVKQDIIRVTQVESDLASGRFRGSGTIEVFSDRFPKLDLQATLSGNKLRVYPFQFAKVRGKLRVHGSEIPYLVEGDVTVESALIREKMMGQNQGFGLKSARYMPSLGFRSEGDFPLLRLNIRASAPSGIFVQNDIFDAELGAKVTVVNTIDTPRIIGTTEIVQGKILFKDRSFNIQSGHAEFDSPTVINPRFNLTALTEVGGTKIQIYAAGRMDKYKIDMSSNPSMPEPEILSLLALGLTSSDMQRLRMDRGQVEQQEAAALLLHSLEFNRNVESKTGFQIELDEAVNTNMGSSIFQRRSVESEGTSPKIVLKRQIGDRVDVSVGKTVGVGTNSQTEVNTEVRVTPGFSVIGVFDSLDGGSDIGSNRSYGIDLKLQKRFK